MACLMVSILDISPPSIMEKLSQKNWPSSGLFD